MHNSNWNLFLPKKLSKPYDLGYDRHHQGVYHPAESKPAITHFYRLKSIIYVTESPSENHIWMFSIPSISTGVNGLQVREEMGWRSRGLVLRGATG